MFVDPRFLDQNAIYPLIGKLIDVVKNLHDMHYGDINGGVNKEAENNVTELIEQLTDIQNAARLGTWSVRN